MGTMWRGMLVPLNTPTGDGRRFLASGVTVRELPIALKWPREDVGGHDGSIVIGSLLTVNIGTVATAVSNGWIDAKCVEKSKFSDNLMAAWGQGELFDDLDPKEFGRLAQDVAEAKLLLEKKVIGPSVEPGEIVTAIVEKGKDIPLSEEDLDDIFWSGGDDVELEALFTSYQIAAVSLVSIPAFEECRPFELLPASTATITAAIRDQGWSDFPLADRELEWTVNEAEPRIAEDAGIGMDSPDWTRYAEAFLYTDENADPETKGAYGFQILDVIDGARTLIPRAVFAVAGVLSGSMGGTVIPKEDQDAMKVVVEGLYARMADEWDDPTVVAPWVEEPVVASGALYTRMTAATPTYDDDLFSAPRLPSITPITITDTGEVYGHAATHDVCHVGIPGECVTAPMSHRDYADFNRYSLATNSGGEVMVGRITVGHSRHVCSCGMCRGHNDDHACLSLGAHGAIGHHDGLATVAWVRAGEDTTNNAIWVHGVISPSATTEDLAVLTRGLISGDWRPVGGNSELVEILALSKERAGFPLPRARMLSGQIAALTAAGVVRPLSTPSGPTVEIDYERLTDLLAGKLASTMSVVPTATTDIEQVPDTSVLLAELDEALGEGDLAIVGRLRAELERIF